MDMNNDGKKKPVSVQGDGLYPSCILSREPSIGQSFQSYHRRTEGVVPFKWELLPGTPKNMPEEDMLPPLSPPPSMLNSSLPKPRFDQLQSRRPNRLEDWIWRKLRSINKKGHMSRGKGVIVDPGLDYNESFDYSSCSSSSTYNLSHRYAMESSNLRGGELLDGPFCCSPLNITLILDEENNKIYYCRVHRTPFTLDKSQISKIMITSAPSLEEPSFRSYYRSSISTSNGIPFGWEMQPGTPIHPPETEVIPPPSPPPAFQGSGISLPDFPLAYHQSDARRRTLMSFFGDKGNEMLQNNHTVETSFDVDKESIGTSWATPVRKSKGLSKLSRFSKKPFGAQFCVIPRTLS